MRKSRRHHSLINATIAAVLSCTLAACSFVPIESTQAPAVEADPVVETTPTATPTPEITEESEEQTPVIEVTTEASDEPEEKKDVYNSELADKHVRLRLPDSGKDVFALWGTGKPDYRYGPSIIKNDDGSIDAWFASPGDGKKEYDWITYRHSDDGGNTWGDERVVLAPTPNTADFKSVCDPDVFCYDGYYYMGYTATVNKEGLCNNVFIARSKNPDGPYEKWDGNGWGGNPIPIVYFEGVDIGWGVGEPSFVVVDDKLFLYNTLDSFSEKYGWVRATQVHTADLKDPEWPLNLKYEGISVYRNDSTDADHYTYADSDSWDVAYLEDSHKFVALTTNRRFKKDSCLLYYESDDGISFTRVSELNTNVLTGCHNCGLMSDPSGHIGGEDKTMIGYAYSGSGESKWGVWATRFATVDIDYTDEPDREEDGKGNLKEPINIDESLLSKEPIMLVTDSLTYTAQADETPINIGYYLMNSYRKKSAISSDDITIEDYDHNILKLSDDNRLMPIHEGITTVTVAYKQLRREICVRVLPEEYDDTRISTFYPVCKRYDISVNEPIIVKVRPMAVFGDYDISELSGYSININNIKFRSSNESVCTVKKDGTIKPVSPGTSVITVECETCKYTLDVYVSE